MKDDKKESNDLAVIQELAQAKPVDIDELLAKIKALAASLEDKIENNE